MTTFWKYHGAGNDFVLLDVAQTAVDDPAALAVRLCERRLGVGADGILLLGPSRADGCDVSMHIFNADGSHAEMCGNGLRCVVKHVLDERSDTDRLTVDTDAGPLACTVERDENGAVDRVRVAMGKPILERSEIPLAGGGPGVREEIDHPDGETFRFTAVSMGNPHAVIFFDDDLFAGESVVALAKRYGPALEPHARFPAKANVAFVRPEGTRFDAVVYERGAGLTAACGTGACAIGVAAGLEDRVPYGTPIDVDLPGGRLTIEVDPDLKQVYMTGPSRRVYRAELDFDSLPDVEACRRLTALFE